MKRRHDRLPELLEERAQVVFVDALGSVCSPDPVEAELVLDVYDVDLRFIDRRGRGSIGGCIALPDPPAHFVSI